MLTYLDFIKKILVFAPKLPEIWPLLTQLFVLLKQIADKLGVGLPKAANEGGLALMNLDEKETLAETELTNAYAVAFKIDPNSQNAVSLDFLRQIWQLAKASPQIMALLMAAFDVFTSILNKPPKAAA